MRNTVESKPPPSQQRIAYNKFLEELCRLRHTLVINTEEFEDGDLRRVRVGVRFDRGENPFSFDESVSEAFATAGLGEFLQPSGVELESDNETLGGGERRYWYVSPRAVN